MRCLASLWTCRKDIPVVLKVEADNVTKTPTAWDVVPDINDASFERYIDIQGCQALCHCTEPECRAGVLPITVEDDGSRTATYCECDTCRRELLSPSEDYEFVEIRQVFDPLGDSVDAASTRRNLNTHRRRLLADHPVHVEAHKELLHLKHAARRRLQQSAADSAEAQVLTGLISDMGQVSAGSTALNGKVDLLEKAVLSAQDGQTARAADKTLEGMIAQAQTDISTGHLRFDVILSEIISKANEAAAAAEAALASLAQIQELNAQYIKSLNSIDQKLMDQLETIKVSGAKGIITLSDALTLWKQARLNRLKGQKQVRSRPSHLSCQRGRLVSLQCVFSS